MRSLRDIPIRRKFTLIVLTTCGAALLLAAALLLWFQMCSFKQAFGYELMALAEIISKNSAAALAFKDRSRAEEVLSALRARPHIVAARLELPDGSCFGAFGLKEPPEWPPDKQKREGVWEKGRYLVLARSVELEGKTIGTLHLWSDYRAASLQPLKNYMLIVAFVLPVSLLAAYFLSLQMQTVISRPILRLADTAQAVAEKRDYSLRADIEQRDEVGQLTLAFNEMLAQIQQQDRALRESQQRFEVALRGSSDGLWDWDLQSDKVYLSPRWKTMLGYAEDELPNERQTWERLLHPDDREQTLAALRDYLGGRQAVFHVEFRMLRKDGGWAWILSRGAALPNKSGSLVRMAGSHTDLTARKQMEVELRLSREKFESLVNSINGIVWEAELNTFAFTFVSKQAERILGYPCEDWVRDPAFRESHIHPKDRDQALQRYREAATTLKVVLCEYRMIAADGHEVWVRDLASTAETAEGRVVLRGVLLDITEQKKAEQKLAHVNQSLREASRQAGMAEVASAVLHNVGNVLNSVNVSASLLQERLGKSRVASLVKTAELLRPHATNPGPFFTTDPKGKLVPEFVIKLAEHLASERQELQQEVASLAKHVDHIKQIVAMQQSCAGVSGVIESVAPAELVEDAIRLHAGGLDRHRIRLVRQFAQVPNLAVDKHQVLQILINLIRNAKQALTDGGDSQDRILTVTIAPADEGDVRISVADNGVGIAQENLTRIFAYGFTTKKGGHGYGLHASSNAANVMGGKLTVHSDGPGRGATFTLVLPINDSRLTTKSCPNIEQAAA